MVFGKGKKMNKKAEDRLIEWVNTTLEKGSDMEQIKKVLNKKYPKKEIEDFLKKNYSIEEEENKMSGEDEIANEMDSLLAEAKGEEPEEVVTPEEVPETLDEPEEKTEEKPKDVPIQLMSTYHIELLNQVASINQGIMKLIKILSKK